MKDLKAEIRDVFCRLSDLLQDCAAEEAERIPELFREGRMEEASRCFEQARQNSDLASKILDSCKTWRERNFPVIEESPVNVPPPTVQQIADELAPLKQGEQGQLRKEGHFASEGTTTPGSEYVKNMVITLYEQGGKLPVAEVRSKVAERMKPRFTDLDWLPTPNARDLRYRKAIQNALYTLRNQEIAIDLEGGVLALTEKGIQRAEEYISA